MKRKQLEKAARGIPESEVAARLASYGGQWALVGPLDQEGELVHIIDNEVYRRFVPMDWLDDDDVWAYAKRKYLEKSQLRRFVNHQELDAYVERLTSEKYGSSSSG